MHYYKRNLGDYAKKAGRLSMLQHGAYTLLLDACYDRERFPTELEAIEWTGASTLAEVAAVNFVLGRYFDRLPDGTFIQNRVKKELELYFEAKKNHWGALIPKEVRCAIEATRNAAKINATPLWITDEQRLEILSIYQECGRISRESGVPHEVDHIVPLRSPVVCGLHVPWNLQIIPAYKNRQKSNRLECM